MTIPCDRLVIATRKSPLALKQANLVADLVSKSMNCNVDLLPMTTTGDRKLSWSLQEKGGKGLFTKELETALLNGQADLAVHSAKDMPTENPKGLTIAAFTQREDPRDVLVLRNNVYEPEVLASGSPRRRAQLERRFPKATWKELRGNVETRIRKIAQNEEADGTILAAAGLNRLGIDSYDGVRFEKIPFHEMVPAPGQAAIAIQVRTEEEIKFSKLDHIETSHAVTLEREILDILGGGCQVALGVHVSNGFLYFFHENCGIKKISLHNLPNEQIFKQILSWIK